MQYPRENTPGEALDLQPGAAAEQAYEQSWLVWLAKVRILILTFLLGIELAVTNLTASPINRRQFVVVIGFCYAVSALLAYVASHERLAITSLPSRMSTSKMKKCSGAPAESKFWSVLKDGLPSQSSATTSPSMTVSSGIGASALKMPG